MNRMALFGICGLSVAALVAGFLMGRAPKTECPELAPTIEWSYGPMGPWKPLPAKFKKLPCGDYYFRERK